MQSATEFKFLTIVIPTYNRCNQVKENLDLTIPQVIKNKNRVRIYISDNASTDGTADMVKSYLERYPDILSYYCQEKNITASPNFDHAVHSVNSEYVFILGDDDLLFPSFVSTVLDLIDDNPEIGLFHLNYIMGLENLHKCKLLHSEIESSKLLKKYETGEKFILEYFNSPSFVSSNLFKRSLWLEGAKHTKKDCPGYVWFSTLLYGCLNSSCAYYSLPVLIQRFPQDNPYSKNWPLYYVYGLGNLFQHLDEQCPGMYEKWITFSQRELLKTLLLVLSDSIHFRAFYKENKRKMKLHMKRKVVSLYFSLCLLPLPKVVMGKIAPIVVKVLKQLGLIK